jgi:uncharacterized membrane protein
MASEVFPWGVAALSGPLHFFLVYAVVEAAFPNKFMGLLPAAFALPMLWAFRWALEKLPLELNSRAGILAWLGGSALFFITLIFPIQFERQWLTLGWALEGVALVWLFQRVAHPGLRLAGCVLLVIAFIRLAFNPAIFSYAERSSLPILNWYLYTYGIVIVCLLGAAKLLARLHATVSISFGFVLRSMAWRRCWPSGSSTFKYPISFRMAPFRRSSLPAISPGK